MMKNIDGTGLPRIGQGTWTMGETPSRRKEEISALRTGIELGMTLIDTAEMYGGGMAELLVGEAVRPFERDGLFIVSKVYPHNAAGRPLANSCEASLRRLGVEVLDLYLLHWRGGIPLGETVRGMSALQREGKIRHWGVSNLSLADMRELLEAGGDGCRANQLLYHLGSRGVEYGLMPWLKEHGMLMMAYCPLAQAGTLRRGLAQSPAVLEVSARHGWTPLQTLLAFAAQPEGTVAIPKAGRPSHAALNAAMLDRRLTPEDLAVLNAAYPPPACPQPLDVV